MVVAEGGETTGTQAARRGAKQRGALVLGVVNVVGSTIARETDAGVYLHVGPEIGVASTKAFTGQVAVLAMIACLLGRRKHMSPAAATQFLTAVSALPEQLQDIRARAGQAEALV